MHIVLYHPEIPPNTGNVARLCAATDTRLHLIEPLGFSLEDKHLKRAGLDYWPSVDLDVWGSWGEFLAGNPGVRLVMTSVHARVGYHEFIYRPGDMLVFGPETKGLPSELTGGAEHLVRIPVTKAVRSINLSTAAGVVLYEALRQTGGLSGARFQG